MTSAQKIWFVTGVSSGFGRCFVEQVTAAGDFVVGTLRKQEQLENFSKEFAGKASFLLVDVNNDAQVKAAVAAILKDHGRIDVLVNNAGYGLFGAVEETSEQEARDQLETNFFGALKVTQAVLPTLRKQRTGTIVQISSVAGFCSTPGLGIYNASKHALEGMSDALAQEVAPLGIKVMLVEPGPYRTKWAGGGSKDVAATIADYEAAHAMIKMIHGYDGNQPGDPDKAVKLVIKAVNSGNPPLRLPLGKSALDRMHAKMANLQKEIAEWEQQSLATAFDA